MAKNTTLKTRIQNRHDTEANWTTASNATNPFIPLEGEVIVYDPDATHTIPRLKIGDGSTKVGNLAFVGSDISKFVTTDTAQDITGAKTFSDSLKVVSSDDSSNYLTVDFDTIHIQNINIPKQMHIGADSIDSHSIYSQGGSQILKFQTENMGVDETATLTLPIKTGTIALTSDVPTNYVTTDTEQTITGAKTFSDTAYFESGVGINESGSGAQLSLGIDSEHRGIIEFTRDGVESYVLTLPDKDGTIALTSDIPSTDNFVTTDTAQTVSGIKQFSGTNEVYTNYNTTTVGDIIICSSGEDKEYKTTALTPEYLEFRRNNVGPAEVNPWIRLIANPQNYVNFNATITLPDTSGTLALTSDIPNTTKLVTTDTAQTISGVKTFSGNSLEVTGGNNSIALSAMNAYSVPTFTSYIDGNATQIRFPRKSGVFALTNDLPAGEVKVQYGDKISSTGTSTPVNVTIDTSTLNLQDRTITAIQIAFGYEGDASMGYRYQIPLQDLYNFRSSTSSTQGDFRYTFNPSVFNYPVTVSRSSTITTSYSNGTQNYSIPLSINFNNNPAYFYVVLGVIYKGNMYAGSGTY